MEKEILASLEIADREVRLLVGQFFNGRLNILKVEKVPHLGVSQSKIMSETLVVEAIIKAVENASRNLGAVIEKVILVLPSFLMKHKSQQIQIPITARVSEMDIKRTYREILEQPAPDDYVLVNTLFTKFFLNGSSTRKVPIHEKTNSLTIEADCYYGKQNIVFPYIMAVEKAGLEVIDIVMDDIAFGKEASLFAASIDQAVINYHLDHSFSKMSLYYQGRLLSNDFESYGFYSFMKQLEQQLKIPRDASKRLLYYNVNVKDDIEHDDPIFVWSQSGTSYSVTQKEIADVSKEFVRDYMKNLIHRSEPIFDLDKVKIMISGEASVIEGLDAYLEEISMVEVEKYESITLGTKDPSLATLLGSFYYYKDMDIYRQKIEASIEQRTFMDAVIEPSSPMNEESMTQKLKRMFFERDN